MQQAVRALTMDQQRSLTSWLLRHGYSWENARIHPVDEWLEHEGTVVTDRALGEAAWCNFEGFDCRLVSISPSDWTYSPVPVDWVHEDGSRDSTEVQNYWEADSILYVLEKEPVLLASWDQFEEVKLARWPLLTFAENAFTPLRGVPFYPGAASRILFLLDILSKLKSCFDENGKRTPEGHEIYQHHFTGRKGGGGKGADFKDSSDTEKTDFANKLSFKHPGKPGEKLICPWHGSVQTPQLRIHFSMPITKEEPLYIIYVGEKITKA